MDTWYCMLTLFDYPKFLCLSQMRPSPPSFRPPPPPSSHAGSNYYSDRHYLQIIPDEDDMVRETVNTGLVHTERHRYILMNHFSPFHVHVKHIQYLDMPDFSEPYGEESIYQLTAEVRLFLHSVVFSSNFIAPKVFCCWLEICFPQDIPELLRWLKRVSSKYHMPHNCNMCYSNFCSIDVIN